MPQMISPRDEFNVDSLGQKLLNLAGFSLKQNGHPEAGMELR
jgi:hypothetical protein